VGTGLGPTVPGRLYTSATVGADDTADDDAGSGNLPWLAVATDLLYCGFTRSRAIELRSPTTLALLGRVEWPAGTVADVRATAAGARPSLPAFVISDGRCLVRVSFERAAAAEGDGAGDAAKATRARLRLAVYTVNPAPTLARVVVAQPEGAAFARPEDHSWHFWTDGWSVYGVAFACDELPPNSPLRPSLTQTRTSTVTRLTYVDAAVWGCSWAVVAGHAANKARSHAVG